METKTIEERATFCASVIHTQYHDSGMAVGVNYGYNRGAEEQKAIDIEKACEWVIQNYLGDYIDSDGYFDNARLANDIRKAME